MDTNVVVVVGNLCADPEVKEVAPDTHLAKIRIAHNTRTKKGEQWESKAHFFSVEAWRHQAEYAAKHLSKGALVLVEGRLDHQQWAAEDGSKRDRIVIVARNISKYRLPEKTEPVVAEPDLPF